MPATTAPIAGLMAAMVGVKLYQHIEVVGIMCRSALVFTLHLFRAEDSNRRRDTAVAHIIIDSVAAFVNAAADRAASSNTVSLFCSTDTSTTMMAVRVPSLLTSALWLPAHTSL